MHQDLGDPLTAEDVRQMLKGVHARATLGVTYAQFVQLVMRDHELHRQDPEEAAGPAMVYADHTRVSSYSCCVLHLQAKAHKLHSPRHHWHMQGRSSMTIGWHFNYSDGLLVDVLNT